MRKKKNRFYTFLLSFLPGAAEMYMGFMKSGISIMAVFCLSIMIPAILRISDVFVLLAVLVWFYSFFHARNLVACDDETFQAIPDDYIWESLLSGEKIDITNPKIKKWGAAALIIFGVLLLWENVTDIVYALIPDHMWGQLAPVVNMVMDTIPQVVVAVLIILIGVKMIMGKKEEMDEDGE